MLRASWALKKRRTASSFGAGYLPPCLLLPWRPAHGRVVRFFCDIRRSDGTGFDIDCRGILKKAVDIAKLHGIIFEFGARNEFYLFKNDENGNATAIPFDNAGFMDAAPEDKGEDVRREICLTLEDMGVTPESSHHSGGPGRTSSIFSTALPFSPQTMLLRISLL